MEMRRVLAVIILLLPLFLAFNACASFNHQRRRPAAYTAHLLHRDSPASPFRTESKVTQRDAWAARLTRDAARVKHLHHGRRRGEVVPVASGYELSATGEYFARLGVGTSPKEYYMIMDTGSDITWLQCKPCDPCFEQLDHPIFDPSMSASLRNVSCLSPLCSLILGSRCPVDGSHQCLYQLSYGDGSGTFGSLVSDTFSFSGFPISHLTFGCSHDTSATFVGAAGILGLGAGPLSFPSQLSSPSHPFNHLLGGVTFSYCLPSMFSSANSTLTFSTVPSSIHAPAPSPSGRPRHHALSPAPAAAQGSRRHGNNDREKHYAAGKPITTFTVPILSSLQFPTFYFVPLTGISVAGTPLPIPSGFFDINLTTGKGGVIVDSGTSVTRFPASIYSALSEAFRKAAASPAAAKVLHPAKPFEIFDTCYKVDHPVNLTQSETRVVPSVVFHFAGGHDLALPAGNVLAALDAEGASKTVCLAFAPMSSRAPFSIIGNMQQQGFRLTFDAHNAHLTFQGPHLC